MYFLFEVGIFYILLLFLAPKFAKKIATIIGTIILAFVLYYLSEKFNGTIQSWQPYTMLGLTFAPIIFLWVRYYGSK